MPVSRQVTDHNKKIATYLAFAIVPLSGLITDIYLPSMPHMAIDLGEKESLIQLTLSLFLISYGFTQIIAGSVIDAYGRYKITLFSLFVFSISCLVIALTSNIYLILAMRILQGICSGFAIVSKRVFFVDVYEGDQRKSYLGTMTIVWAAAPILAPFVGGYLEDLFGWRSNFYVLAGYGFLMLILEALFSGETINQHHPLKIKSTFNVYWSMFKTPDFTLGVTMTGICYGMVMMFSMSGPFIIEHEMGYSPVTAGYVSLLLGIAWMSGGFLAKFLIKKASYLKSLTSISIQFVMVLIMMGAVWYGQSLWSMTATAFLIHVSAGFIFNIFFAHCLARFPQYAGISNGITGGVTFFYTSFLSYGSIAVFNPLSQPQLGISYLALTALGLTGILLWIVSIKKSSQFDLKRV
tara:strand:+ start:11679 stop:12902 length:1224 start_codon:yes stop_codon:yes gene_type:complete